MANPASARRPNNFYEVLQNAIDDLQEHGFDSELRLRTWLRQLEEAARRGLVPTGVVEHHMRDALQRVFERALRRLPRLHRGVSEFTLAQIKPKLRAELDRRILASAALIKLNRESSIARTLQRFSGWATSIPTGGSATVDKRAEAKSVRKGIAGLPFIERRVIVDQGHKLAAAINEITATDGGAIAAIWHSHWRELHYNYRPEHKRLDGKIFLVRGSWALDDGFVRRGAYEYTDEVDQPAQPVNCRCYYQFLYNLGDLPRDALTEKGRAKLAEVKAA